jgi:hypothetical protein
MKLTYVVLGFILLFLADVATAVAVVALAMETGFGALIIIALLCLGCAAILIGFIQDLIKREGPDFKRIAEALWQILDDVDTLGDQCKSDDKCFRSAALVDAARRFEFASSNGYRLTWKEKP